MSRKGRRVSFALPEEPEPEEREHEELSVQISLAGGAEFDNEVETAHDVDSSDSDVTDSEDSEAHEGLKEVRGKDKKKGDLGQKKKRDKKEQKDSERLKQKKGKSKRLHIVDVAAGDTSEDDGADSEDESNSESDDESEADHSETRSDDDTADISSESGSDSEPENDSNANGNHVEKPPAPIKTFTEMGLDPRLERAIEKMDWLKPTPIQSAVIPAALHGRDVLVSAPTGSGKTAAYAIPIVQHICKSDSDVNGLRAVVLVPTRELVHQVASVLKGLCKYVDGIQVAALTGSFTGGLEKNGRRKKGNGLTFGQAADIVVGTPAAVISGKNSQEGTNLSKVEFVVVDEADLVLSYGYENDAKTALSRVPVSAQSMLLSATLEAEGMDRFKKVILRRPLIIKITSDEGVQEDDSSRALHYYAKLKIHRDRYLVTYAMLRLNVITGKVLIFVNHINTAFRLKLFLDQFKVKSAVLNSELPVNSRVHCVEQFNAGVFDILIASDESNAGDSGKESSGGKKETRSRKRMRKDSEFGLSRGMDFRDVAAVFNFDVPETAASYMHRAGRTARAGKAGTVLTLICNDKEEERLKSSGKEGGCHIAPLAFRMDQIEAFRYRVEDALRMVTDAVIHGARLADVRREIVNSEQLKDYFEDNPDDLDALQHNLTLAKNIPEHLAHIPSYLIPPALRGNVSNEPTGSRFRGKRRRRVKRGNGAGNQRKKGDPLKTFTTDGLSGSARQRYRTKHGIKKRKGRDPGQTMVKKRRRR